MARQLGLNDAAKLLEGTLQAEIKADRLLTQNADANANRKAA